VRTRGRSWRFLRKAGRGRPRHARAIFAKYRSDSEDSPRRTDQRPRPPVTLRLGARRLPTDLVEPRGLNRRAAAEYIGVGTTLFDAMVGDGRMPRPFRVGARVIWDRRKLDAAFDALSDQDEDRNPWDATAA
jgi:predicted DNA-binding transcriptional regulator AlpA